MVVKYKGSRFELKYGKHIHWTLATICFLEQSTSLKSKHYVITYYHVIQKSDFFHENEMEMFWRKLYVEPDAIEIYNDVKTNIKVVHMTYDL